jgi:hypothetical protein
MLFSTSEPIVDRPGLGYTWKIKKFPLTFHGVQGVLRERRFKKILTRCGSGVTGTLGV